MLRRLHTHGQRHALRRLEHAMHSDRWLLVHPQHTLEPAPRDALRTKMLLAVLGLGALHTTLSLDNDVPPLWTTDAGPGLVLLSPTKPSILIVNDNLPTNVNGVVTFLANMERHASAYSVSYLNPSQFPHIDCPGYPDIKLSLPFRLVSKLRSHRPDFIHIATEGPLGLATRLYCDLNRIPYNSAYHTRIPEYMEVVFGVPEAIGYAYLRWFHRNSAAVLTTTDTMVHELRRRGFKSLIQPMKFGVDRRLFRPTIRRARETTTAHGPILLSVGRVSKEKGLDAFCDLDYPGATKIVVGDGPYRSELEARYPEIQFVGLQTGEALAEYYANADVLVFTSRTDTFGLVMIESLACGTPVAAFPVPGPLDAIECGVTGHLSEDLRASIDVCLGLDRAAVATASEVWSWEHCWATFEKHLVRSNLSE
ncbi:hypothetical protein SDRG_10691 [Saprolegnia diclina VS20]|uniref:Glycosyltransferase subfamily 4-like N-terminal domain-containing protein n=1 Tax=Saprolegnia diclina (strain VS20) TaxID=1156394 RepID=T0RNG5_SAPDV|nr:hypothetical protein SDRG_10691 [Saprolegnia diclina VS20]EQC31517.1 hypothetical protein SDRG_10691 [Saprolegnia diclina VS20]|eukprot:XP_008614916.1 hypothetical protein SDRG_10691 [Saprolegnia diclina VS20]